MNKNNLTLLVVLCLALGFGVGYVVSGDNNSERDIDDSIMRGDGMMGKGNMMGRNIDQHFIEQMTPHHQSAIMMALMLSSATERKEMEVLAENIITSQSPEIAMMRNWIEGWAK